MATCRAVDTRAAIYRLRSRNHVKARRRGHTNVYLILLDYSDSREEPHGVYVGMTRYKPAERYDQQKVWKSYYWFVPHRGLEA